MTAGAVIVLGLKYLLATIGVATLGALLNVLYWRLARKRYVASRTRPVTSFSWQLCQEGTLGRLRRLRPVYLPSEQVSYLAGTIPKAAPLGDVHRGSGATWYYLEQGKGSDRYTIFAPEITPLLEIATVLGGRFAPSVVPLEPTEEVPHGK